MKGLFGFFGDALKNTGLILHRTGSKMQGDYGFVEKLNRHTRLTAFGDNIPFVGQKSFIAPNASIIGDVVIGKESSIWYNAVLRGDVNSIYVGNKTVISDRTVVHCSSNGPLGPKPTQIGDKVYIGPGSIVHAAIVHDESYIGTGSTLCDGSTVEKNGFLEAGSLLTAGKTIKSCEYWGGSPAKFIRQVTKEDVSKLEKIIDQNITLSEEHDKQTSKSAKELNNDLLQKYAQNRTKSDHILNNPL
ncbi:hypothetical protein RB653_008404 [Dictyostelium firmibasis]|uniref:Uncharacterized protein n=1 Tax=Dictyostelium firmibasis TaxID=79012 RepID=A0AAN7YR50_9MYCE